VAAASGARHHVSISSLEAWLLEPETTMKTATRKNALLVIDVQESFRSRPYWQPEELPAFLANTQRLIDGCRERGIAVLQIFHQEPGEDVSNPFHPASGLVRAMPELKLVADAVFYKEVHSALYGKTSGGLTLEKWLRDHGVEEILVTGIRTEQCCETTTRHASDVGFKVRFATDATLTFPMRSRAGRTFSSAEIRERTELVLDERFARIVSAAEALGPDASA
jgi:nicotinamidase-related amidase